MDGGGKNYEFYNIKIEIYEKLSEADVYRGVSAHFVHAND